MATMTLPQQTTQGIEATLPACRFCGTALTNTFGTFVLWRIAGGVAIGMASSLSPVYIAEVAPAHLRGRLVSLNQLTIVIGILLAQVVNWMIARPLRPLLALHGSHRCSCSRSSRLRSQ